MHNATHSRPKRLFLALPVYAQVPVFWVQSLLALQRDRHDAAVAHLKGGPPPAWTLAETRVCQGDGIARSRNQLAAQFLRSDCTHLLFIDCDLIFHPDHVSRLLEHDEPIVGGLYPKKQEGPLEWVLNTLDGQPKPDERGLQPVRYLGTGFLCIRRDVFTAMAEAHPESRYKEDYGERRDDGWEFFPMGVHRPDRHSQGRYLSEDWYFCERAQRMGIPVLADTRVVLKHIGPAIYPLSYQETELFARAGLRPDGTPLPPEQTGTTSRALQPADNGAPAVCALAAGAPTPA